MCRIAVLDSERASLKSAKAAAQAIGGEDPIEVSCFTTKEECLTAMHDFPVALANAGSSAVSPFPYDMLLVSARLNGVEGAGVSFVAQLQESWGVGLQVAYMVSGLQEISQLYSTQHVAAIPKPVTAECLGEALRLALANSYSLVNRPLLVRTGGNFVQILPNRVGYIESDRRKICIHHYGLGELETYASISSMLELLSPLFVQCHKSYLVNMNYVRALRKENLLMLDGTVIPVSQKRRTGVKRAIEANLAHRTAGIQGAGPASA